MLGYKGFNENLKCGGKWYEVGKSYHEDETVIGEKGMYFCTDPLDVFYYYSPIYDHRFCLVEADNISEEKDFDTIRVCKDLTIIKEFSYKEYYKEICKYHNSKNGIIEKDDCLHIFSNNNIYIEKDYSAIYLIYIYGNNNVVLTNNIHKTHSCGISNVVIDNIMTGCYAIKPTNTCWFI